MKKQKADYAVIQVDSDRIFLVDLLGEIDIQSDAERICVEMQRRYKGKRVICRDDDGEWTELRIDARNVVRYTGYDEYVPDVEMEYQ